MKYILNRLKERSTWLGLISLAAAFGITLEPALVEYIAAAGMAVAGIIGMLTSDGKEEKHDH